MSTYEYMEDEDTQLIPFDKFFDNSKCSGEFANLGSCKLWI